MSIPAFKYSRYLALTVDRCKDTFLTGTFPIPHHIISISMAALPRVIDVFLEESLKD